MHLEGFQRPNLSVLLSVFDILSALISYLSSLISPLSSLLFALCSHPSTPRISMQNSKTKKKDVSHVVSQIVTKEYVFLVQLFAIEAIVNSPSVSFSFFLFWSNNPFTLGKKISNLWRVFFPVVVALLLSASQKADKVWGVNIHLTSAVCNLQRKPLFSRTGEQSFLLPSFLPSFSSFQKSERLCFLPFLFFDQKVFLFDLLSWQKQGSLHKLFQPLSSESCYSTRRSITEVLLWLWSICIMQKPCPFYWPSKSETTHQTWRVDWKEEWQPRIIFQQTWKSTGRQRMYHLYGCRKGCSLDPMRSFVCLYVMCFAL